MIKLTQLEKEDLRKVMTSSNKYEKRKKAHTILMIDRGYKVKEIASLFDTTEETVKDWISRWETFGIDGLNDKPSSGK